MTESTTSSHSVKVCLGGSWEVEIENHINCWDVNTSREEIASNQASSLALGEVMEYFVPFDLRHLGVDEIARVI